jgi:hypothetical protein
VTHENRTESWPPGDEVKKATLLVSDALCFPHPTYVSFRSDLVTPVGFDTVDLEASLMVLADTQFEALGRLVPGLLCGEESAFQVFSREGYRISSREFSQSQALAYRIAAEELEHERLLQVLRGYCPVPGDLVSILRRTRRFFRRISSRDIAVHFAGIAALDSSTCIILSTIVKPVSRATVLTELFNRIRRDEARHVKFSRQHSCRLGAHRSVLECIAIRVRTELVSLLHPLADSFEDLGVDADQLFRRVARNVSQPDC